MRLVTFCASGVLTVGRASTIARDTIVAYLRRKDFITEFTDGIDEPVGKEQAIKEFYGLLSKTGFDVKGQSVPGTDWFWPTNSDELIPKCLVDEVRRQYG